MSDERRVESGAASMRRVGDELRRLREAHALTQQVLAQRVGVSRSHLCQVELGQTWASADMLARCEDALGERGRLVSVLRAAKVPAVRTEDVADALDVVSHKFMPVRLSSDAFLVGSSASVEIEGVEVERSIVIDDDGTACDAWVFPFGVAVLHFTERQRFPNVANLALWRQNSYPSARAWAENTLRRCLPSETHTTCKPAYVLSLYEVKAAPWQQPEDVRNGMRLLCMPSTLLDRRAHRDFETIARAEAAEHDLMRHGFDNPEIVDFGVKGVSTGFASWAGVSYFAHAPSRALATEELIEWELLVQALWCYADSIITSIDCGDSRTVDDAYGVGFLRRMAVKVSHAPAREHLQRRVMKDAVLTTSRLTVVLDQAQMALQNSEPYETAVR